MQRLIRPLSGPLFSALLTMLLGACTGESDSTESTDRIDAGSMLDVVVETDVDSQVTSERRAKFIQIRDDPTEIEDLECDGDLFPGADIDSIVLFSGPSLSNVNGYLDGCTWMPKGESCPTNSGSKSSGAEGKKNGNAFEGFTSLNGGILMCQWSDGVYLELGNVIQVIEVGPSGQLEKFQVRACRDSEANDCGEWQTGTLSQLTFPASTILPPS